MNLYLIFIIIISLIGIEFFVKKTNKNYLSKENTTCVKGIFILIVFYSHMCQYISTNMKTDFLMYDLRIFLGQLMVAMFLFYSGYGVYESIKKKDNYVKTIPVKRIFITLFNFMVAVGVFLIVNIILGNSFPIKQILFSFIAWSGIGNSNWYIFAILSMYLLTYISFTMFDKKKALGFSWILSLVFILFMAKYREPYWFSTVLCYNLGITYSYFKKDIEKLLFDNKKYIITLLVLIVSFFILRLYKFSGYMYFEIMAMIFCLIVVFLTGKINLKSPILNWFGKNLFWVYILQRLPMLIMQHFGYEVHKYRFFAIAFVSTIILTFIFSKVMDKVDNFLLKKLKYSK